MNPLTLKNYAIQQYNDDNLHGFSCILQISECYLPYVKVDDSIEDEYLTDEIQD